MTRRILVFGSRAFPDPQMVADVLFRVVDSEDILMHGACPTGPDAWADEWWATWQGGPPVERYPADWDEYGKAAGPIRNWRMANLLDPACDIALGFWDGQSRGTLNMLTEVGRVGAACRLYVARRSL